MAVTLFVLRMQENLARMNEDQYQMMQNSRTLRKLANLASSIADGHISPSEIGALGDELFGDAMEFMDYSDIAAQGIADENAAEYESLYGEIMSSDYYQNSSLREKALMYTDEDGNLNLDKVKGDMYEQALEDYANDVLMPALKEKETELQNENDRLQTEYEQLSAEYDSLKQSKSQEVRRETIQLS